MTRPLPALAASLACLLASTSWAADGDASVEAYVRNVPAGPASETVSRWRDPVCPLVAGLAKDQAEFVLTRLSHIAFAVGAPLAEENCAPNLFIVVSSDPKALVRQWTNQYRDGVSRRIAPDIERALSTGRSVRVWRDADSQPRDGRRMSSNVQIYGGAPVQPWANDSRIGANVSRFIWGALVMLDPSVGQVQIGQLADYVALASLAEVDLEADPGDPQSILNLFRAGAGPQPQRLSALDEAYLRALYAVPPHVGDQRRRLAMRMAETASR